MSSSDRPVIVIIPGATLSPTHYGYLTHLLNQAGYPTLSCHLPSIGSSEHITAEDDTEYIRKKLLLPTLDIHERNVIILGHSYGAMPASAAVRGLGKGERKAQGKTSAVLGQIFVASLLLKGGDGKTMLDAFGSQLPEHIKVDKEANLVKSGNMKESMFHDLPDEYADALAGSLFWQGLTSMSSPAPRASWDHDDYKGRRAYVRTVRDTSLPFELQKSLTEATGLEWITKDIDSSHSPQVHKPEALRDLIVDLAKQFEAA